MRSKKALKVIVTLLSIVIIVLLLKMVLGVSLNLDDSVTREYVALVIAIVVSHEIACMAGVFFLLISCSIANEEGYMTVKISAFLRKASYMFLIAGVIDVIGFIVCWGADGRNGLYTEVSLIIGILLYGFSYIHERLCNMYKEDKLQQDGE